MISPRIFHFAVKPGCDPVYLPSRNAHALLPWLAKGCQVFEWHWVFGLGRVMMLKDEIDRRYEFCGVEPTAPNVSHAAQAVFDKVMAITEGLLKVEQEEA